MAATRHQSLIQRYLSDQLLVDFALLDRSANLFELGLIDSFGFIELISYLELEFGIEFTDDDMMSGKMASFDGLVRFVGRKLDGRQT